jgi:hypothetical protein
MLVGIARSPNAGVKKDTGASSNQCASFLAVWLGMQKIEQYRSADRFFLWFCFDIVGVGSNELRRLMQSLVDVRGVDVAVRASLLVDDYKCLNASNETIMINRDDATHTDQGQRTRVREGETCPISEISSM